ncbi:hypothetical protein SNE40_017409 [Patella caerulea]|uniref:Ig-like domain-containing protein n=1 Tax=Patella caerulea TaxID=87958 RepID=A0AAN8JH20_PATCE
MSLTSVTGQRYSLSGPASYGIRGGDYRFICQISGGNIQLNDVIQFTKNNISICRQVLTCDPGSSSDTRYTCGCSNGNKRQHYLKITNVTSTDAGTWTCGDTFNTGTSSPVTIPVYYGPENIRFTPTISSIIVIENDSRTVTCLADCNPTCNISWYKGTDTRDAKIFSSKVLLQLNNIQRQDRVYTCQAKHRIMTTTPLTKTLQITVYYGPENIKFTPTSSSITAIENESRIVTCSANCNPPPCNINWYKKAETVASGRNGLLQLINIKRQQAGNYTCQVANTQIPDSLQSKQLMIIVHYPPTITSLISDATNNMIDGDSTVTFTCSVDSLPSSIISWSRSQQGEQPYSGSQYTIPKAGCQHTDNYTCTASNNIGQPVSKTIPLYVRCIPVLDPKQESKTSISVGRAETGVLSIHVLAYPLPVYTWYYQPQGGCEKPVTDFRIRQEDDGLSSTLTIQDVTEDDSGKYIVYVNNSLGTRSTLFNLAVTSQDEGSTCSNQCSNNDVFSREPGVGVGIAIGVGICFIIVGITTVLLWIIWKKTGKKVCFKKMNGDKTVVNDTVSHNTELNNINLSDTPHVYDHVSAANTRDTANTSVAQASTTQPDNTHITQAGTTDSGITTQASTIEPTNPDYQHIHNIITI